MLKPLDKSRWSLGTAAHLLNRAGFGGTPAEIRKLADLSPDKAVSSLIDYEHIYDATPAPDWAKPDPDEVLKRREAAKDASPEERKKLQQEEQRLQTQHMLELREWWLSRMTKGLRPFQEKMVLFWHGHFATSIEKVRQAPNAAYLMWRQNELFRRLATSNWEFLLLEVGKDPAMLVWLDQAQSRKEHPNENFAREVMELFSLGEGHYTEKDITEAARALTGWSYDRMYQKFIYRPAFHDDGVKTVLSRTGNLDGDDVIAQIVAQPQAARFITAKLWNYFAGQYPSEELNEALAAVFREFGNNFKPLLRVLFRCEEFYAHDIVRNQVKCPVQWLVGTVRLLECDLPPAPASWGITRGLGQDLFAPPNVKGWDGGMTWITTNTLLMRYNLAQAVVQGNYRMFGAGDLARKPGGQGGGPLARELQNSPPNPVDVEKILGSTERSNQDQIVAALEHRLLQASLKGEQEKALRDFLASRNSLSDDDIRSAIRLVMATPQYQVT